MKTSKTNKLITYQENTPKTNIQPIKNDLYARLMGGKVKQSMKEDKFSPIISQEFHQPLQKIEQPEEVIEEKLIKIIQNQRLRSEEKNLQIASLNLARYIKQKISATESNRKKDSKSTENAPDSKLEVELRDSWSPNLVSSTELELFRENNSESSYKKNQPEEINSPISAKSRTTKPDIKLTENTVKRLNILARSLQKINLYAQKKLSSTSSSAGLSKKELLKNAKNDEQNKYWFHKAIREESPVMPSPSSLLVLQPPFITNYEARFKASLKNADGTEKRKLKASRAPPTIRKIDDIVVDFSTRQTNRRVDYKFGVEKMIKSSSPKRKEKVNKSEKTEDENIGQSKFRRFSDSEDKLIDLVLFNTVEKTENKIAKNISPAELENIPFYSNLIKINRAHKKQNKRAFTIDNRAPMLSDSILMMYCSGMYLPVPSLPVTEYTIRRVLYNGSFGDITLTEIKGYLYVMKRMHNMNRAEEVFIMKQLEHPLIIKFITCWRNKKQIYMLMEPAIGGTLQYHIVKYKHLFMEEIRFVGAILIDVLDYLQNLEIAHLDIKPANICVHHNGYVKIGDFGSSRYIKGNQRVWGKRGTQGYIAPEVEDRKAYKLSADIYSYAATLYNMATGMVIKDGVFGEKFPSQFSVLLQTCLVLNPEFRPSCKEIKGMLFFYRIKFKELRAQMLPAPARFIIKDSHDLSYAGFSNVDIKQLYSNF